MLQPQNYPRLLGQALTLEPAPAVEMVDDDNPWVEGLFFVFVVSILVAVARLIGGLLLSASLPPADAVLEALVASMKQGLSLPGTSQVNAEILVRQLWVWMTPLLNYGSGWLHLLILILTPLVLIGQWLLYTVVGHATARMLGGNGTLGQTLGAVALSMSPHILLLVTIVPFVSVHPLLLHGWGILIAYRGLEVAHDLAPNKAAIAAAMPLILGALMILLAIIVGIGLFTLVGSGI